MEIIIYSRLKRYAGNKAKDASQKFYDFQMVPSDAGRPDKGRFCAWAAPSRGRS